MRLRGSTFPGEALIGQAYGSVWEAGGRDITRVLDGALMPDLGLGGGLALVAEADPAIDGVISSAGSGGQYHTLAHSPRRLNTTSLVTNLGTRGIGYINGDLTGICGHTGRHEYPRLVPVRE